MFSSIFSKRSIAILFASVLFTWLTALDVDAQTREVTAVASEEKFPGELNVVTFSKGKTSAAQIVYVRPNMPQPARLQPIGRLGSFTQGPGGVYCCSGLDSMIFLVKSNNERMIYHGSRLVDGVEQMQIRHVEYSSGYDRLFFSVVPTPQNNESLQDGTLFGMNLATNQIDTTYHVRQADVDNDWWGQFTIAQDNSIYLASRSRIHLYDTSAGQVAASYAAQSPIQTVVALGKRPIYVDGKGVMFEVDMASQNEKAINAVPATRISDLGRIQTERHGTTVVVGIPFRRERKD